MIKIDPLYLISFYYGLGVTAWSTQSSVTNVNVVADTICYSVAGVIYKPVVVLSTVSLPLTNT
jgi:hypothetical protein